MTIANRQRTLCKKCKYVSFVNSEKRKKKFFSRGFNFANWLPVDFLREFNFANLAKILSLR